ncbi:MAG: hypothetical protein R2797_05610 [Gelidibacter sp.]
MKRNIPFISVLIIFYFCSTNYSFSQSDKTIILDGIVYQANVDAPLTDKEDKMIREVYGDNTQKVVFENPQLLKDLKSLLRNRMEIIQISDPMKQKATKMLSEMPLNNQYNPNLKRSVFKDVESFNPLVYSLDFFAKGSYLYRIDNTDYFIKIISQYRQ